MKEKKEYNKVFDYILKEIECGNITSGSRLPSERKISSELSVSRNSTREALRSFEILGISESIQGSGNYITGDIQNSISQMLKIMVTLEKFSNDEVCTFRKMLEKAVCLYLIERNEDNSELIENGEKILNTKYNNASEEARADKNFHYLLIESTNNKLMISMMQAVANVYRSFIDEVICNSSEQTIENIKDAHRDILYSIEKRNINDCFKAIDYHYTLIEEKRKNHFQN